MGKRNKKRKRQPVEVFRHLVGNGGLYAKRLSGRGWVRVHQRHCREVGKFLWIVQEWPPERGAYSPKLTTYGKEKYALKHLMSLSPDPEAWQHEGDE